MDTIRSIPEEEQKKQVEKSLIKSGIQDQKIILAVIAYNTLAKQGLFADDYINILQNTLSEDATLVMNCFTWDSFCQNNYFHIQKTPSEVGLASELFRRMPHVVRSPHPIYSLCAKGPLADELMTHDGSTCWGKETPFEKLVKHNCYCVNIGTDLSGGITLFHHFEEMKKVPYRTFKRFSGTVNFGDGEHSYSTKFYVRSDMNMKYSWKPAIDLLKKNKALKEHDYIFKINAVSAKDLQKVCNRLLDENREVFVIRE